MFSLELKKKNISSEKSAAKLLCPRTHVKKTGWMRAQVFVHPRLLNQRKLIQLAAFSLKACNYLNSPVF